VVNNSGTVNQDALDFDGVSPWFNLEFTIVRPLTTFGKVENYQIAARNNITVKKGDVQIQRSETYLNVATAYYGFLTARDSRAMLDDAAEKIQAAKDLIEKWLEDDEGKAKQSDLFAMETGLALIERFQAEAVGFEKIAMAGLRMLTGVAKEVEIELADKRLKALPLPELGLQELQLAALKNRPEMSQVEAGLTARRALVEANKAEFYPNVYAGVGGRAAYSPEREITDLDVWDEYNTFGVTPVVGVKWDWYSGRQHAKVAQAQAELDALLEKKGFALQGIPFQVAEAYHHVQAHHQMVQRLYKGARSGRRWLISSYADFEAGVEDSDKVSSAFQGYLMAYGEYLQKVNDFNLHIAKLRIVTGEIK
jgi:outer membrane protein